MDYKLPYYMAYPMPLEYDDERKERQDMEYMRSMYPEAVKRILPFVEDECDRMEYEGSMIYDEYPDMLSIRRMCSRICDRIREIGLMDDLDMPDADMNDRGMMNEEMMNRGMMNEGMMNRGMMDGRMTDEDMINEGMMNDRMMDEGMEAQQRNRGDRDWRRERDRDRGRGRGGARNIVEVLLLHELMRRRNENRRRRRRFYPGWR